MTIIKIYMFIVMILCPFLNWYNEKWFKYTLFSLVYFFFYFVDYKRNGVLKNENL